MADPAPIAVATIHKNSREEIRVGLTTYRGTQFVDVRVYVDGSDDERRPTPKGVTVRPENVPALIDALQRAHGLVDQ